MELIILKILIRNLTIQLKFAYNDGFKLIDFLKKNTKNQTSKKFLHNLIPIILHWGLPP